jgi:hypothetical protein
MATRILSAGRASVTRRAALFVSGLAAAAAPASAAPPSPDAKLLDLCQLWSQALLTAQQYRRFHVRTVADEERHRGMTEWLDGRVYELQGQVAALPATTLAGLHAKARVAQLAGWEDKTVYDGLDPELGDSLCRDLLALSAL